MRTMVYGGCSLCACLTNIMALLKVVAGQGVKCMSMEKA